MKVLIDINVDTHKEQGISLTFAQKLEKGYADTETIF
jgi:hypothetical protein